MTPHDFADWVNSIDLSAYPLRLELSPRLNYAGVDVVVRMYVTDREEYDRGRPLPGDARSTMYGRPVSRSMVETFLPGVVPRLLTVESGHHVPFAMLAEHPEIAQRRLFRFLAWFVCHELAECVRDRKTGRRLFEPHGPHGELRDPDWVPTP